MKGQGAGEFIIVYATIMIIFLLFYVIYLGEGKILISEKESLEASRNAYSLATAINYVHLAGPGASYNFSLSMVQPGENITISDMAVSSVRERTMVGAPLLNGDVNASRVYAGNMVIRDQSGVITIAQ